MSFLVFVNGLGSNYRGNKIYEFIFSDNNDVWGDDWDTNPANGNPTSPEIEKIRRVGVLNREDIEMELIQNSDFFCMKDAVDNVIALAWESDRDIEDRLVFHYGMTEEEVKDKLYEKDIILEFYKEFEKR
jgi:ribosomal protein S24E